MSYVDTLLATGEEIVYTTKKHWIAPLFSTVTGTLLTVGGLAAMLGQVFWFDGFLNSVLLWGGLGLLLVGLGLLVNAAVKWWAQFYFVTNQKVMKVEGILRKSTSGSALEKINDITMEQSLLGRWLGFGTVRVLTAADESNLHYTVMRQPVEFRKAILDSKLQFEKQDSRDIAEAFRAGTQPAVAAAPAAPAAPSVDEIADSIERLAQLRDSGAITTEEFEAKKVELLDRM
ncbi:MAG TPA: PH domain-containing protein [Motilibacterales bacterium]|nr:PH domain-containing protein [Motilibacterales bacterium]